MINILRFLCVSLPTWILYAVINLVLGAIGIPLIWWQAGNVRAKPSKQFANRWCLQFNANWMRPLWGNEEDGVDGLRNGDAEQLWWGLDTLHCTQRERIFKWSALRNSVGNFRWLPFFNPMPPKVVNHWGKIVGRWILTYYWSGAYSGARIVVGTRQLTVGWKFWDFPTPGQRVPFAMRYQNDPHTAVNVEAV